MARHPTQRLDPQVMGPQGSLLCSLLKLNGMRMGLNYLRILLESLRLASNVLTATMMQRLLPLLRKLETLKRLTKRGTLELLNLLSPCPWKEFQLCRAMEGENLIAEREEINDLSTYPSWLQDQLVDQK